MNQMILIQDVTFLHNKGLFFDKDINDQVIASPKTTANAKVIRAMKKLQASCNDDANKIIKEAMQVKVSENLNFLINYTMQVPEEPSLLILEKNGEKPFARSLPTWISNRYGVRPAKLLGPIIEDVLKMSGSSRSRAMVCTGHVLLNADTVKYWALIFQKTTLG